MFRESMINEYLFINQGLLKILLPLVARSVVLLGYRLLLVKGQYDPPMLLDPSFRDQIRIFSGLVLDPACHRRTAALFFMGKGWILHCIDKQVLHRDALVLSVLVLRHNVTRQPRRVAALDARICSAS